MRKVDVVIPTAHSNRWPATEAARLIRRVNPEYDVGVILIESNGPGFSFAKSVNRGLAEAREDADVFLLNDDCFMDEGWFYAFNRAIAAHPDSYLFGALLRFPEGDRRGASGVKSWLPRYQHAGGYVPVTVRERFYTLLQYSFWNQSPIWMLRMALQVSEAGLRFPGHYNTVEPHHRIQLLTGAALWITRAGLDDLGSFDEIYPLSFEDTDFCLRSLERGKDSVLVTDATGVHYESLTSSHLKAEKRSSFRVFAREWPEARIKNAVLGVMGIIHPDFCGCGQRREDLYAEEFESEPGRYDPDMEAHRA